MSTRGISEHGNVSTLSVRDDTLDTSIALNPPSVQWRLSIHRCVALHYSKLTKGSASRTRLHVCPSVAPPPWTTPLALDEHNGRQCRLLIRICSCTALDSCYSAVVKNLSRRGRDSRCAQRLLLDANFISTHVYLNGTSGNPKLPPF